MHQHSDVVADHCLAVQAQDALTTCPCITMPDQHPYAVAGTNPPMVNVSIGGQFYNYPAGYGIGSCAPHDQVLGPTCANADGSVKADAPSWCSSNWCFVDPNACTGLDADSTEPVASTYFHRDGVPAEFHCTLCRTNASAVNVPAQLTWPCCPADCRLVRYLLAREHVYRQRG